MDKKINEIIINTEDIEELIISIIKLANFVLDDINNINNELRFFYKKKSKFLNKC